MQYMGGKARIARRLTEVMLERRTAQTVYLEPFIGGGNVFCHMAPHFDYRIGADSSDDLVKMWAAVRDGWVPPDEISREQYREIRSQSPSALRGFVGFGCSFGGKWWGGYAAPSKTIDNYAAMSQRTVLKQRPGFDGSWLYRMDYRMWCPDERYLIYCDPPYAGTTNYTGTDDWDPEEFWATVDKWAGQGALVFVSEYEAPPGWEAIWQRDVKVNLRVDSNIEAAKESLWVKANA
jgi:DNA adenine methylase